MINQWKPVESVTSTNLHNTHTEYYLTSISLSLQILLLCSHCKLVRFTAFVCILHCFSCSQTDRIPD